MKKLILAIAMSSIAFSGSVLAHTHHTDRMEYRHDAVIKNFNDFLATERGQKLYQRSLDHNLDNLSYSDVVHSDEVEKAKRELLKQVMPPASRTKASHYDIPESWKQHKYQHRVSERSKPKEKAHSSYDKSEKKQRQHYRDSERFQEIMKERREHNKTIREKQRLIEEQELDIQILENEMRIKKLEKIRNMSQNFHNHNHLKVNKVN